MKYYKCMKCKAIVSESYACCPQCKSLFLKRYDRTELKKMIENVRPILENEKTRILAFLKNV
jgi:Zn-finger nucleic acid-binding protein